MIYGSKTQQNGKKRGALCFDTGKRIVLSPEETIEYENKIKEYQIPVKMQRNEIKKDLDDALYYLDHIIKLAEHSPRYDQDSIITLADKLYSKYND